MALFSAFSKIVSGLAKTRRGLMDRISSVVLPGRALDESAFEALEEALIASDLGAGLSASVMQGVRRRARQEGAVTADALSHLVRAELLAALPPAAEKESAGAGDTTAPAGLRVVMVVGVNGGGKTTTVGKLAARYQSSGKSVVIAAADTFRAAAIEQVQVWAERSGAHLVRHGNGADPSAVVFDAVRAAAGRKADILIIDTAGRLHTRANLMQELEKIVRIVGREAPGAPHEVILVLDATTGQNGLSQAREFLKASKVTSVALTKLDGTARGGIALAISRDLGLPLRYVGVGEAVEDLVDFDPNAYVEGLLGPDAPGAATESR
jgi:fused signal recognition particle receptor